MRIAFLFLIFLPYLSSAQKTIELSSIMKGSEFIGHLPTDIQWSLDSKRIYFNEESATKKNTFFYQLSEKSIDTFGMNSKATLPPIPRRLLSRQFFYKEEDDHLVQLNSSGEVKPIFNSQEGVWNVQHVFNENKVYFQIKDDLYAFDLVNNYLKQVTSVLESRDTEGPNKTDYLSRQEKSLFIDRSKGTVPKKNPRVSIYTQGKTLQSIQIAPNEEFFIYRLSKRSQPPNTDVMRFLSEDGFSKVQKARPKAGTVQPPEMVIGVHSLEQDTSYLIDLNQLPGLKKAPVFYKDYDRSLTLKDNKALIIHEVTFSPGGKHALLSIKSFDNKDRWLLTYEFNSSKLTIIEHQHDEAWIGGPGISGWNFAKGTIGWISNNEVFFQSEESGFSHLYSYDLIKGAKTALTKGSWEVHKAELSKDQSTFFITANKTHPGNRTFYHLNISTKELTPILSSEGAYEVEVSPDEKWLAFRYSYKNKPWELYYSKNSKGASPMQITQSTTEAFNQIEWISPDIVEIPTEEGLHSNARLYQPDSSSKNGAAVIFVHGAGYLQNAHNYWSGYYREYMFHHVLLQKGYTVLDIDYRASAGYGRDHRTAIYRHMGDNDLQDQIYGKKWLVKNQNIDEERVGIYGGSYGGFITLMALLKHPGKFQCGGALRSVTDWAHYNHPYTSNILNTPELDSIAYKRSSPIYFADGLEDRLIMFHGMVDDNVQYQDIIRLSQRFIELGKTNWNLASYPIEAHSFKTVSSWTDEYRRLLNMFNNQLLK
jgi:dipeptidyl aminopeptidase/acylaminoacyl peptidase